MIELLVVIAIIAILASMLLPALSRAKSRALAANDINNCKQCMLGMSMYVLDNSDFMPAPGWGTSSDCWAASKNIGPLGPVADAVAYQADYNGQLRYFSGIGLNPPAPGLLYQYLKSPKLLLCPQDVPDASVWAKRRIFITSYIWDGAIIAFGRNNQTNGQSLTYKLSKFKASNILQWENNEKNPAGGQWNDFSNYPLEAAAGAAGNNVNDLTFSQRHGRAAQVGRMDGSAARIPYAEMAGMALDFNARNDLWYSPLSGNGH